MFQNTANTSKKYILNGNDFKHLDSSKEKTPISWKQNLFLKWIQIWYIYIYMVLKIVNPCTKNAPHPSKSCMGFAKSGGFVSRTLENNRDNIALEMDNCIGFWTSKCTKPAQGQKTEVLNFKMQQNCTGAKLLSFCLRAGTAHFEVKSLCFFSSPCRFGALWS